jgi:hypothetical protein
MRPSPERRRIQEDPSMRTTRLVTTLIAFGLLSVALCLTPATASAKGHKGQSTTQPAEHHKHKHKHKNKHKHENGTTNPSAPQADQ